MLRMQLQLKRTAVQVMLLSMYDCGQHRDATKRCCSRTAFALAACSASLRCSLHCHRIDEHLHAFFVSAGELLLLVQPPADATGELYQTNLIRGSQPVAWQRMLKLF